MGQASDYYYWVVSEVAVGGVGADHRRASAARSSRSARAARSAAARPAGRALSQPPELADARRGEPRLPTRHQGRRRDPPRRLGSSGKPSTL
jgi:hypothetical protein